MEKMGVGEAKIATKARAGRIQYKIRKVVSTMITRPCTERVILEPGAVLGQYMTNKDQHVICQKTKKSCKLRVF